MKKEKKIWHFKTVKGNWKLFKNDSWLTINAGVAKYCLNWLLVTRIEKSDVAVNFPYYSPFIFYVNFLVFYVFLPFFWLSPMCMRTKS